MKSKREIFAKVKENKQLRGVVPVYDAQGTVKFDDEIGEKGRFETKTTLMNIFIARTSWRFTIFVCY